MSREVANPNLQVVETSEDLLQIFRKGGRSPFDFQIGMEFERFLVDQTTLRALHYDGPGGIRQFLVKLSETGPWEPTLDNGNLIGLRKGDTAITLEPGGQVEISCRTYRNQHCLYQDLMELDCQMKEIASALHAKFYETGIHPTETVETAPWMPKSRYQWMRKYYEGRSRAALEMMLLSASIQVNFDYIDEEDAKKKVLIGSFLGPVLGAVYANSSIELGKPNGYMTRRIPIWEKMDSDRCGTPRFFVDGSFTFEKYRDYALDVPMYFALRDGQYVDAQRQTFRQFLNAKGGNLGPVTLGDWEFHLTTLFPEMRLKNHLEFRTIDSNSAEVVVCIAALWKGLFHDPDSIDHWYKFFSQFNLEDLNDAMKEVAVKGLQAKLSKQSVLDLAKKIFENSKINLERNIETVQEVKYLEPMKKILSKGRSPAEIQVERFSRDPKSFLA